ncbi:MFS family permease [Arthrobacter sp. ES3-54]|nr:MFS family permease [Arthrobacter sp. ES3-54]
MQRTAQDWLVFAHLTAHDAGAVGITMALQLGPQLFLAPVAGLLADRFNRKRLLVLTQSAMALLSAGLGILVVSGAAQLWHVYAFALMLGVVSALDAQTTTDPVMRGRVMALYMAIFMGGTPIGAPLVGWVANTAGPRWSMAVAAGAGLLAALIGLMWIIRARHLRLHFNRRAHGLRYFRVESGTGAASPGSQQAEPQGAQPAGPA